MEDNDFRELEKVDEVSSTKSEIVPVEAENLPALIEEDKASVVVDLPDGQKLLLGSLPPGVVIEVATWRGTGRPDSRTQRLLLGMSGTQKEKAESPKIDDEQLDSSSETDTENRVTPEKFWFRRRVKIAVSIMAVILLGQAVFGVMQVSFVHPKTGLSAGLGDAKSAVVAIQPITEISVGDFVIVSNEESELVLGAVTSISSTWLLVTTGNGFLQIETDKVDGKVLFVVPFVGNVLSVFDR